MYQGEDQWMLFIGSDQQNESFIKPRTTEEKLRVGPRRIKEYINLFRKYLFLFLDQVPKFPIKIKNDIGTQLKALCNIIS